MNLLVTDPYNVALSDALTDAVQVAGLTVAVVDLGSEPSAIDTYRLGTVPCLARLHRGRVVYGTSDPATVPTFDADADAIVASLTAPEPAT